MTPLALEMLIWFCTRATPDAGPFHNIHRDPQQEIMQRFLDDGIIRNTRHKDMPTATDKGMAWLKLICATPVPVQQWIDPRTYDVGDMDGQDAA